MESIDQEQSMNRRVLQALTAIQGDTTRAVSVDEIVQHVAYLMSPDEAEFARDLIMNSLETLKTIGLIRETHKSEYALFRYPLSTKKQSKENSDELTPIKQQSFTWPTVVTVFVLAMGCGFFATR